jgi:DNA-binding NarL/FixJ family response regulator
MDADTPTHADGANMRILIADDQERVRFALRVLLAQQSGLEVVGEVSNGEALLALASTVAADLALVDWELPRLAGAGGLPGIHRSVPALQIVVLSSRPGVRQAALAMGGAAFVSKGEPPERLLTVIRRCSAMIESGGPHVTPE